MHGEILVGEVMDRMERLKSWQARQERDAEWVALKQWWRSERQVAKAQDDLSKQQALAHRSQTAWLYRAELARAWPKWTKMREELNARARGRL